jgi:hypothetical protein
MARAGGPSMVEWFVGLVMGAAIGAFAVVRYRGHLEGGPDQVRQPVLACP